jgi:hypothetical protein
MSFMFESSTISIISKITIETITKATKIVIKSIEKEFVTKIATEVATESIEEEVVSNEKKITEEALLTTSHCRSRQKRSKRQKRSRQQTQRARQKRQWTNQQRTQIETTIQTEIQIQTQIAHRWIAKCRNLVFVSLLDTRFANELVNLIARRSRSFRVTIESKNHHV